MTPKGVMDPQEGYNALRDIAEWLRCAAANDLAQLKKMRCFVLHQNTRIVLLKGTLPFGLDDVFTCSRCEKPKGGHRIRNIRNRRLAAVGAR